MVKPRLMFSLLWNEGQFALSRNFGLQNVGDVEWLEKNYNFPVISSSIDELSVINVCRSEGKIGEFSDELIKVTEGVYLPVTAGGTPSISGPRPRSPSRLSASQTAT